MKKILALLFIVTSFNLFAQEQLTKEIKDLIPTGHEVLDIASGDLNSDGRKDYVLLLRSSDHNKVPKVNNQEKIHLTRRGLLVILSNKNKHEIVVQNLDCFSSENVEGGLYYTPELFINIKRGNLYINFAHGKNGSWKYTFRSHGRDFALIGFDQIYPSEYKSDYVLFDEKSINYLTHKQLVRKVVNVSKSGNEIFKEIWNIIPKQDSKFLSAIKNFDDIEM